MEIIFVRHGEAKHELGGTDSRQIKDPRLTGRGKKAALKLRELEPLSESDAVVAGPSLYLLQTADLWSHGTDTARFVHPLAGPRQYPFRFDFQTQACDRPVDLRRITAKFPELLMPAGIPEHLWVQGIHTLPGLLFAQHADRFLDWCRGLEKSRVFIVTSEGTIRAYRAHVSSTWAETGRSEMMNQLLERWSFPLTV